MVALSKLLEKNKQGLSIHIKVCSAKVEEALELLGAERYENAKLNQKLEDKIAVSEDLCKDNASQKAH